MMKLTGVMNVTILGMMVATAGFGGDWAVWRGPKSDGTSTEKGWNPASVKTAKVKWEAALGVGYSSVVVCDGRVYSMGNGGGSDVVYCLDEKTGKQIWAFKYACKVGRYKGPRATPVVVDGNVFTLSREGHAYCLDAKTGKEVWKNNVLSLGPQNTKWGLASTPLVAQGMVFYNAGVSGVALDVKTGKKVWASSGLGGYAVPTFGPKGNLLIFSATSVVAVKPKTGAIVWEFPWKTSYNVNASDPVVIGDKVFLTSGYGRGCCMLDLSSGKPKKLWENKTLAAHFSTPVVIDGNIYGVSGNTGKNCSLISLDPKTGNAAWSEKIGFASLMAADGKLIILSEKGVLRVVNATPAKYELIAETTTKLGKTCWTHPVICNGTIYCRNDKGLLLAVDVGK